MTGDQIEVVIDHDGVFPALRPVRVSYFDPATGEPTDHQVGVQRTRPNRPLTAPGKGQAPFNGYPADAGARPQVKRVCPRCGGGFMVPRQGGGSVPRTCPECRKEARLERDLRRQAAKAKAMRPRSDRPGVRNPGRAGVEVVAYDRLTGERTATYPTIRAAADAGWFTRNYLTNRLSSGPVTSGWTALARADEPRPAWPRPVVADDGRVRVAFADREAVREAFGLTLVELSAAVDHGRAVGFHGREVGFAEVEPSAGLAGLRRWRP